MMHAKLYWKQKSTPDCPTWCRCLPGGSLGGAIFAAGLLLLHPGEILAQDISFPRGPGLYFSIPKLIAVLALYLLWVRTSWWVDQDARELNLATGTWNGLMLGAGALGLLVVWLLPWFIVSSLIFLGAYIASSLIYVSIRNQEVPEHEKVLTKRHLKELAQRYLKINIGEEEGEARKAPPIRFVARGTKNEEDPALLARAEGSKGYKAALEMVYEAIQGRATDIHMEPTRTQMTVRFRVDGMLHPADPFSRVMGDAVINIFKVLSNMDIIEKRKPQDGSFSAEVEGTRSVDFRVATAGSVAGEKLVMRIFDRGQQITSLAQLGMDAKMHERIYTTVTQPHGMLIVCGPTGAGKSTTLYSALNEIDRYQRNVITVENPVECQVNNVTQIEINPKAGKTFATELRSILRQDPDVIMIGEVRDQETAEIACQAAQTGHMVFTTLHANDSITAVVRLLDLGVQPSTLASAISGVLAQRLVRALCPKCKVRYKPNPEMLRKANLPVDKIKYFYRPPNPEERGQGGNGEDGVCENCGGSGYRGRTGVFELLVVNDRIRELIRENPNINAIKQESIKNGLRFLQEDGLRQVILGKTSIQEVLRVCK